MRTCPLGATWEERCEQREGRAQSHQPDQRCTLLGHEPLWLSLGNQTHHDHGAKRDAPGRNRHVNVTPQKRLHEERQRSKPRIVSMDKLGKGPCHRCADDCAEDAIGR